MEDFCDGSNETSVWEVLQQLSRCWLQDSHPWSYVAVRVLQDDSFEVSSELIIINHATNYRRKQRVASTYPGRRGVNWLTEDVKIQFLPGWRQAVCSRMWPISMAGEITETKTAY